MAQYMSPAATNLALEGRGEAREVAVVAIAQRRASWITLVKQFGVLVVPVAVGNSI